MYVWDNDGERRREREGEEGREGGRKGGLREGRREGEGNRVCVFAAVYGVRETGCARAGRETRTHHIHRRAPCTHARTHIRARPTKYTHTRTTRERALVHTSTGAHGKRNHGRSVTGVAEDHDLVEVDGLDTYFNHCRAPPHEMAKRQNAK